jgi:hypothetical protein
VITITRELLESWEISGFIPDELLPMGVMDVFGASIPSKNKVRLLLHEEVLDRMGLVYVAARAVRRACTKTGWDHPDSLRALDLCDRYVEGEEVPEEELWRSSNAAEVAARAASNASVAAKAISRIAARVAWAANVAANAARAAPDTWAATWAWAWATTDGVSEEERRAQLTDCRDWLLRNSPQERAPVPTRYQRIMRSLC